MFSKVLEHTYFEVFVLCLSYTAFLRALCRRVAGFWQQCIVLLMIVLLLWCLGMVKVVLDIDIWPCLC